MAENSGVSEKKRRGPGRPFQPGRSGNPGGRPKHDGWVRELAQANTERAIQTLVDALDSADERIRLSAANALLDRGWGRASSEAERIAAMRDERDDVRARLAGKSRAELLDIATGGKWADGDDEHSKESED